MPTKSTVSSKRVQPRVTVIGSGTGVPSLSRGYPSILIRAEGEIMLLDTGPCTLARLLLQGVTYVDIDRVFYTHLHPDHSAGMTSMLFAMRNAEPKRTKPLRVFGPPGLKEFYGGLNQLYGNALTPKSYELNLAELSEEETAFDGWKVRTSPMAHMVPTIGYRLEFSTGEVLAYSGDTDYCENIVNLAKGADVLVLECSFPEDLRVEGHLVPSLCARVARESGCRRLVLNHFYPQWEGRDILEECGRFYDGEIILAEDFVELPL
ncbi:MAG: ribonuclease Z [Candidatus Brocadiales bacterium]